MEQGKNMQVFLIKIGKISMCFIKLACCTEKGGVGLRLQFTLQSSDFQEHWCAVDVQTVWDNSVPQGFGNGILLGGQLGDLSPFQQTQVTDQCSGNSALAILVPYQRTTRRRRRRNENLYSGGFLQIETNYP